MGWVGIPRRQPGEDVNTAHCIDDDVEERQTPSGTRAAHPRVVPLPFGRVGPPALPAGRQVTSKPSRRAARAFCLLARSRRSRLTSIGSAARA
jgi:hypothetical protein